MTIVCVCLGVCVASGWGVLYMLAKYRKDAVAGGESVGCQVVGGSHRTRGETKAREGDVMNCASCYYWELIPQCGGKLNQNMLGTCLRHAPVTVVLSANGSPVWPITNSKHWCGDYQQHPTRRLAE